MDLGSLLLALALLLLVAAYIARPILDRAGEERAESAPADAIYDRVNRLAERENVLAALRDLDFDHTTGKIAQEDYRAQRAALVGQGVAILRQLDALGLDGRGAAELDTEIEAAIAARRRAGGNH